MVPSEKIRLIGLIVAGSGGIEMMKYGFGVVGSGISAVCAVLSFVFLYGRNKTKIIVPAMFVIMTASCLIAGFGIFPTIQEVLDIGKNCYPVSTENTMTKEELFDDIGTICEPYATERNKDWLDVTWKWMDEYFANPDIAKGEKKFMIMFRVNDDMTYDMLDCLMEESTSSGILGIEKHKNIEVGRFYIKKYYYATGIDTESEKVGMNGYYMDTEELREYMRKWFADRGYRER